jgi:hypothetical protein
MKLTGYNINLSSSYLNSREIKTRLIEKEEFDENGIEENGEQSTNRISATSDRSGFISNKISFEKDVLSQSLGELIRFRQNYEKDEKYSYNYTLDQDIDTGSTEDATNRLTLDYETSIEDKDIVSVGMTGLVQTEDGKDIEFGIELNMSREFVNKHQFELDMVDPLVINFGRPTVELSDEKFTFDIDSDGKSEQISNLANGSGFLALDKDGNGKVTNGSELFGTQSGNGFEELKIYDEDQNGFIDENDSIFESLRVWKKTDTQDQLVALGEVGVGAIYLGYTESPLLLQSTYSGQINGAVKNTGLFIKESGDVGTVQNIDLVKTDSRNIEDVEDLINMLNEQGVGFSSAIADNIQNNISGMIDEFGGIQRERLVEEYNLSEVNMESVEIIQNGNIKSKDIENQNTQQDTEDIEETQKEVEQKEEKDNKEASEKLEKMREDIEKMVTSEPEKTIIDEIEEGQQDTIFSSSEQDSKIKEIDNKTKALNSDISSLESMKSGISIEDNYIDIQIAKAKREIKDLEIEKNAIESENFLAATR